MNFEAFDRPADLVESNLGAMNSRADEALVQAYDAINALAGVDIPFAPAPSLPAFPDIEFPDPVDITAPRGDGFGSVPGFSAPAFEDLSAYLGLDLADLDVTVPEFVSSIGTFILPTRPAPIDTSGLPTAPTIDTVTVPSQPDITLPDVPTLVELDIPAFVFPEIPAFTDTAPVFDGVAPDTDVSYVETTYSDDLLTEITAKVRSWLQGGTGLPAAVEAAIFESARARIHAIALDAEQTAFDVFAGRGFSMPPGMLVAQVNAAREKASLDASAKERELTIYVSETEIKNLQFAMEKGIAIEGILTKLFSDAAGRSFELAKFRVEADLKLYDATVSLFNAKQGAYSVAANVFKIKVEAALSELEVFKAQIQGEIAKGQANETLIRSYEARVKGILAVTDVFKSQMEGARIAQDVNRGRIEAFKASTDAFSARVGADAKRFDAYEAEVRAEAARAGAFESEARAYAETVRAQGERANVKVRYIDAKIAALNASTTRYSARAQAELGSVTAALDGIRARASAFSADVGRYTAEIQGQNVAVEASVRSQELRLRNLLSRAELQVKEYDAFMGRVIELAKISQSSLEAAGRFTSALATGAMSAIRVGADIGARGSVSDQQSYNININRRGADTA